MSIKWTVKDPDETVDYAHDWSATLAGDTISTSLFELVTDAGLTIDSQSNSDTTSTVWLSGGTAGQVARLKCAITTAGGRTFDELFTLPVTNDAEPPELVTLDEAKAHLGLEVGQPYEGDSKIEGYIAAEIASLDGRNGSLGRSLRPQTLTVNLDRFPACGAIRLPYGPVLEVVSVQYVDGAGASQSVDPADYGLTTGDILRPAYSTAWPAARNAPDAVTVTYRAGYDGNLPDDIKSAILFGVEIQHDRPSGPELVTLERTQERLLCRYRNHSI
jgi:uncharacterized phiE125 gp8 family phage protein